MIRNPIATTTRCLLGTWAGVRAADSHMRAAKQVRFGGASPGPGQGDAST